MVYCSIFDFLMVILCIDKGPSKQNHKPFHEFQKPHLKIQDFLATPVRHRILFPKLKIFLHSTRLHWIDITTTKFKLVIHSNKMWKPSFYLKVCCLGKAYSFILTRARIEMFVGGKTKIISWWCDQLEEKKRIIGLVPTQSEDWWV